MSLIRLRRLRSDREALDRLLAEPIGRHVTITETWGTPPNAYRLSFDVPGIARMAGLETGGDGLEQEGPFLLRRTHEVLMRFPAEYPFRPPEVAFTDGLFHPNVYPNGRLCWGQAEEDSRWWRGGEGLDTLIERLLQITVGDPMCVNPKSPANVDAVVPYRDHATRFPLAPIVRTRQANPESGT